MELQELIANIHELRSQYLQRIGAPLERVIESEESKIIVPINNNLKMFYYFGQPLSPEEAKRLLKKFKRDDSHSEVWKLAGLFDYTLQSEIAEEIYSKDPSLECLTQLPGFEKGFGEKLVQEFLINLLDLRGDYFSKYVRPVVRGFKIEASYRADDIRSDKFEESLGSSFDRNVSNLLKISNRYIQFLNSGVGNTLCNEWNNMLKLVFENTNEAKQMIGSYKLV